MTLSLHDEYFRWICSIVYDNQHSTVTYNKLLRALYDTEFVPEIQHDENRAIDGIDLRYRFGREMGYKEAYVASRSDIKPCSVLEMMVALSLRCEEHIMDDATYGDRTGQWFWNMVVSLGLGHMNDRDFYEPMVRDILYNFMTHNYQPDGVGGLFTIEGCPYDLRTVEIWCQQSWYLNNLKGR